MISEFFFKSTQSVTIRVKSGLSGVAESVREHGIGCEVNNYVY